MTTSASSSLRRPSARLPEQARAGKVDSLRSARKRGKAAVFTLEGSTGRQVLKAGKKVKSRRAAELDFEEAAIDCYRRWIRDERLC